MMNDLELRDAVGDAIDRLDSGFAEHPDLAAIMAGGRRQRRRRRALWTASGVAVAAAVVPAALAVGGQLTAPSPPTTVGVASSSTPSQPPPFAGPVDVDRANKMDAAVADALPGAQLATELTPPWLLEAGDGHLHDPAGYLASGYGNFGWEVHAYRDGASALVTTSQGISHIGQADDQGHVTWKVGSPGPRLAPCSEIPSAGTCSETVVDGRAVQVVDGEHKDSWWSRTVEVTPAGLANDDEKQYTVNLVAYAEGETWAEAEASMPSVETLTALALDERMLPPSARS